MNETGHSGLVHWDDPERWSGEGTGRGVQDVHLWLTHVNVWREPLQFVKIISPQLKKKNLHPPSSPYRAATGGESHRNQTKGAQEPHILARLLPAAVGRGGGGSPQQLNADRGCHLPREQTPRLAESEQVLSSGNTADRFSFESKSQQQNGSQTCG